MSLSPIAFFGLLDETNPIGTDSRTISDDQHRNIIASMKQQAPNWTAAITATHGDVNLLAGYVAAGQKPMPGVGGTTVSWFYNATVPVGWTIAAPDTNLRNLCVASGGATPVNAGTIQGSTNPSDATLPVSTSVSVNLPGSVGNTTLTQAQVPATGEVITAKTYYDISNASTPSPHPGWVVDATAAAGGGQGHSHPLGGTAGGSGSGTATFNPRRAVGVLGSLNA